MNVLITDGFDNEVPDLPGEPYTPHNILYGNKGWTDGLDDDSIDLLMKTGSIRLDKTIHGVGFETRIYVSNEGVGPQ